MKIGKHFGTEYERSAKVAVPVQQLRPVAAPVPVVSVTALARFVGDIGTAIKADALAVLQVPIKPVETQFDASQLANRRAQARVILKDIEARRKLIVEPLKKEAAAVDAEARTWADPLKAWDQNVERVLLAYQRLDADRKRREAEAQQEEIRKAAEAQAAAEQAGDAVAVEAASVQIMRAEAAPVAEPIRGFKTDAGSQSIRTRWMVEVVNAEEVPDAYMVPDLARLQKAVDSGAREIAGCNIFPQESMPVRTR